MYTDVNVEAYPRGVVQVAGIFERQPSCSKFLRYCNAEKPFILLLIKPQK